MKRLVLALALVLCVATPLALRAQQTPPPAPAGPSSDVRAKFEALHAQAKTAALNALTPDHRTQVEAIVAQVVAGSVAPRDAAKQIDGLLTPDETQALGAVEQKTMSDVHAAFAASGYGPPHPMGPPPPAPVANGSSPVPVAIAEKHRLSPGRFLLGVSLTREQMFALRHHHAAPSPAPN